jgi:hypothetical protein
MSDLIRFLENLDPKTWPWADVLILIGLCGGIVFAIWIVGGALRDIIRALFTRPNKKLGGHVAPSDSHFDLLAAATVIGGSLAAIIWILTR